MAAGVNLRTTDDLPVDDTNPLSVKTVGGGTGTSADQVQGNVASGAADSGNPVKVGGVFSPTPPSFSTGQRGDLLINANGALVTASVSTTPTDGSSNSAAVLPSLAGTFNYLGVLPFIFNGTTWDRRKKPNAVSRIVSSAATTNATSAKTSAGEVHSIIVNNTNAAIRYLKLYNKASAPTVGTDVPFMTIPLHPLGSTVISFPMPVHFSTGIAYALTTGSADSDTGALTAADIVGLNIAYA